MDIIIGIDPGTKTGLAVWTGKKYLEVKTMTITKALFHIKELQQKYTIKKLYCENPNTYVPFKNKKQIHRLQGAGSIKRDFAIWETFCEEENIKFIPTRIIKSLKKISAKQFKTLTGWDERTSEHSRDAACLILNRKIKEN